MPLFQFRCHTCQKVEEEILNIRSTKRTRKCKCGGKAKRLLGTGTAVVWEVPPGGHWFPTVGKTCHTRDQFLGEANKIKRGWAKEMEDKIAAKSG